MINVFFHGKITMIMAMRLMLFFIPCALMREKLCMFVMRSIAYNDAAIIMN